MTGTSASEDRMVEADRSRFLLSPAAWVFVVAVVLGIALVSFLLGVNTGDREVEGSKVTIQRLQNDNGKLDAANKDLQAKLADLQATLASARSTLGALMPSENNYEIAPNQSLMVADGHLIIGLIGTPGNDSVNLNINGKQYSAAAGDVFNVAAEPSLTCRVEVVSFDVLKAQAGVRATCAQQKQ